MAEAATCSGASMDARTAAPHSSTWPTHFIGVELKSAAVHQAISDLQETMIAKHGWMQPLAEAPVKFHITMLVLVLGKGQTAESTELIHKAKEALQSCKADVDHLMSSFAGGVEAAPRLPTAGLNGFAPTVIYVDFPKKHATYRLLQDMQNILQSKLEEAGIPMTSTYKFVPHATLFKEKRYKKRLKASVYKEWRDVDLGECYFEEIQLLEMGAPPGEFYVSLDSLPLGVWPSPK